MQFLILQKLKMVVLFSLCNIYNVRKLCRICHKAAQHKFLQCEGEFSHFSSILTLQHKHHIPLWRYCDLAVLNLEVPGLNPSPYHYLDLFLVVQNSTP